MVSKATRAVSSAYKYTFAFTLGLQWRSSQSKQTFFVFSQSGDANVANTRFPRLAGLHDLLEVLCPSTLLVSRFVLIGSLH